MPKKRKEFWIGPGYRGEYSCPHGVGHGNHVHGCDGCCQRDDFPLRGITTKEQEAEMSTDERIALLEKTLERLWEACRSFKVEIDNCEGGCCPTYADMDLPTWEKRDGQG